MESSQEAQLSMDAPLTPRDADSQIPLVGSQRRAWMYVRKHSRKNEGTIASATRISGRLDVELLRRSVEAVVLRHESLRTTIVAVDGSVGQCIDAGGRHHWEMIDLSRISSKNVDQEARRRAEQFAEEEIDLAAGPLFKSALLKLSTAEHVLVLATDHMVSDAASAAILKNEIWSLYELGAKGLPLALPELAVQFADYAIWQRRTYEAWRRRHEAYWKEHLTGAPSAYLPLDGDLKDGFHRTSAALTVPFGKQVSLGLAEIARRENVSVPLVTLAIHAYAMSRWCDQSDLVVRFVSHGRHCHSDLKSMIGLLASCLYLRIEIVSNESFIDLLKRISVELDSAFAHFDFDRVMDITPECTATDVGFNWVSPTLLRGAAAHQARGNDALRLLPFPIKLSWLGNLLVFYSESAAGVAASVTYRTDLFSALAVERFGRQLRSLALGVVERPLAPISSFPMSLTES